jgi:hypothetical protein
MGVIMSRAHYYRLPDLMCEPVDLLDCKVFPVFNARTRAQTKFYLKPVGKRWIMDTKPDPQATGLVLLPDPLKQGLLEADAATVLGVFDTARVPPPPELLAALNATARVRTPELPAPGNDAGARQAVLALRTRAENARRRV